jgi:hypothetical protein
VSFLLTIPLIVCSCNLIFGACMLCCRREASFSSPLPEDEPQDYEHDAIVVHMGRFAAETPLPPGQLPSSTLEEDAAAANAAKAKGRSKSPGKRDTDSKDTAATVDADGAAAGAVPASTADSQTGQIAITAALTQKSEADLELLFAAKKGVSKKALQVQQLHLYSIACPGMRRWPDNTQDLGAALAWAEPVNMKPGWAQLQKGFFQAPGGNGQTAGCYTPFCPFIMLQQSLLWHGDITSSEQRSLPRFNA